MPILSADQWFAAARRRTGVRKTTARTTVAAQMFSMLDIAGNPGAGSLNVGNTANGLVPTDATPGFPNIVNFAGGALGYLGQAEFRNSVASGLILYDRLFHVGSIALNSLATTTLSAQPSFTSRLPDGTDYSDIDLLLEINATVSATATTVSVNFNDDTNAAQASPAINVNGFTTGRVEIVPLTAGIKFPKQVNSVTVGGTVATTGSVNVILARRLGEFDVRVANGLDPRAWDGLGAPILFQDSALWPVIIPDSTSSGFPRLSTTIISG